MLFWQSPITRVLPRRLVDNNGCIAIFLNLPDVIILRTQIQCLEAERIIQEETLKKFKDTLQNQKTDNHGIREGLEKLKDVDKELSR